MKRLLAFACMITCIFGLTACGSEEQLTAYEQQKVDNAEETAKQIISLVLEYTGEEQQNELADYTWEEVGYKIEEENNLKVDGYAFTKAVESFDSAMDTIGAIKSVGEPEAKIDDDEIIVHVPVEGETKDAEAEVILSNDRFLVMSSAALNPISSMGELMGKAALNTLIGMGTVFVVLILISLIIYCFGYISKIQGKFGKKNDAKKDGIDKAVAQIVDQEENADESDDLELVAVIAAAIAASEGASSTDGFVVRSIRRAKRL